MELLTGGGTMTLLRTKKKKEREKRDECRRDALRPGVQKNIGQR